MKRRLLLFFVVVVLIAFLVFLVFPFQFQKSTIEKVNFPFKKNGVKVLRVEPEPGKMVGRNHHITIWVEPPDPSIMRASITVTPKPEYIMKRVPAYVPDRYLGFRWEVTAENGSYKVEAKVINHDTGNMLEFSWSYRVGKP